jgi:hypothetical protein
VEQSFKPNGAQRERDRQSHGVAGYQRDLLSSLHFWCISRYQAGAWVRAEEGPVGQGVKSRRACEVEPMYIPALVGWGPRYLLVGDCLVRSERSHNPRHLPVTLSLLPPSSFSPCLQFRWPAFFTEVLWSIHSPCRCGSYFSFVEGLHSSARRHALSKMAMPAMSPTMTEGGISTWKKAEGESFSPGDVLLEIVCA